MLEPITSETLAHVRTPEMRDYARIYLDVYQQFARDVEQFGLPFARQDPNRTEAQALRCSLPQKGVQVRSGGASLCGGGTLPPAKPAARDRGPRRCCFPSGATGIAFSALIPTRRITSSSAPRCRIGGGSWTGLQPAASG